MCLLLGRWGAVLVGEMGRFECVGYRNGPNIVIFELREAMALWRLGHRVRRLSIQAHESVKVIATLYTF